MKSKKTSNKFLINLVSYAISSVIVVVSIVALAVSKLVGAYDNCQNQNYNLMEECINRQSFVIYSRIIVSNNYIFGFLMGIGVVVLGLIIKKILLKTFFKNRTLPGSKSFS